MCYMNCRYENFDGECTKPVHIMCPLFYEDEGYQAACMDTTNIHKEDEYDGESIGRLQWKSG